MKNNMEIEDEMADRLRELCKKYKNDKNFDFDLLMALDTAAEVLNARKLLIDKLKEELKSLKKSYNKLMKASGREFW